MNAHLSLYSPRRFQQLQVGEKANGVFNSVFLHPCAEGERGVAEGLLLHAEAALLHVEVMLLQVGNVLLV